MRGKHIIVAVSAGIAAYKAIEVVSRLRKKGAEVKVVMTQNSTHIASPLTFGEISGHPVAIDMFEQVHQWDVEHIALATWADAYVVVPATANVIGKIRAGIADDMLTTTVLASRAPKIIAPAMNTAMYENPVTQDNIELLKHYGMEVITPASGHLACGDSGAGKMPEPETLFQYICKTIAHEKDMAGMKVLVTAGPTQEAIDPVRYITNHSSGKMGYSIAKACMLRGADVTLVTGRTALDAPLFVNTVPVISAKDMYEEVTSRSHDMDIIIKAAAVADYRPCNVADEKIKKKEGDVMSIPLERTDDILKYLGEHKEPHQFLCGFSMETQNMLENSKKKLMKKNLDMIVANNLKEQGAGFETDTNIVTMITQNEVFELELMSKEEVAFHLLDKILELRK